MLFTTAPQRLSLFSVLLIALGAAQIGCASSTDEEANGTEDAIEVASDSADCVGETVSFTLTRTSLDSYSQSAVRPARYRISNIRIEGVPHAGSFSDEKSPLGVNFRAEFWNGIPLVGSRYLTESRMHAEKPLGPDNRGTGWGGPKLSFNEHVRCEVARSASPSFAERFRRSYESLVTGIASSAPSGNVVRIDAASEASVPANLRPLFRTGGALSVYEYEGQRVYERSSPYSVFYDASGQPFARGAWMSQSIPEGTPLSPAEWENIPRKLWRWGLD